MDNLRPVPSLLVSRRCKWRRLTFFINSCLSEREKMTTTTQRLSRMQFLRDDSNGSLFERLTINRQIMQDRDWIEANFKSDAEALESLHRQYFPLIGGMVSPGQLIELIDFFPSEDDWKSRKYNLQVMIDELPKSTPERATPVGPSKDELRQMVHDLELQVARKETRIAELEREVIESRGPAVVTG